MLNVLMKMRFQKVLFRHSSKILVNFLILFKNAKTKMQSEFNNSTSLTHILLISSSFEKTYTYLKIKNFNAHSNDLRFSKIFAKSQKNVCFQFYF